MTHRFVRIKFDFAKLKPFKEPPTTCKIFISHIFPQLQKISTLKISFLEEGE